MTESYISQLLTRKKAPPAPERTDIYDKMDDLLGLPPGELARVAEAERKAKLKRKLGGGPEEPLFGEVRALILRKCDPLTEAEVRPIFEAQPFGELERLVTERLLDVVKTLARQDLDNDDWLHAAAKVSGRRYEQMHVAVLEFLDADIFQVSEQDCVSFLDPLITSWDIDLATFALEIVLNRRVSPESRKRFEFVERVADEPFEEPGLQEFLRDPLLSATVSAEELELLGQLRFKDKRPRALFFYRALQNLRDPLHFD